MAGGCITKFLVTKIMEEKNVCIFVRLTRPQKFRFSAKLLFFAADFVKNRSDRSSLIFLSILWRPPIERRSRRQRGAVAVFAADIQLIMIFIVRPLQLSSKHNHHLHSPSFLTNVVCVSLTCF